MLSSINSMGRRCITNSQDEYTFPTTDFAPPPQAHKHLSEAGRLSLELQQRHSEAFSAFCECSRAGWTPVRQDMLDEADRLGAAVTTSLARGLRLLGRCMDRVLLVPSHMLMLCA
jgi:hypothetical protein